MKARISRLERFGPMVNLAFLEAKGRELEWNNLRLDLEKLTWILEAQVRNACVATKEITEDTKRQLQRGLQSFFEARAGE